MRFLKKLIGWAKTHRSSSTATHRRNDTFPATDAIQVPNWRTEYDNFYQEAYALLKRGKLEEAKVLAQKATEIIHPVMRATPGGDIVTESDRLLELIEDRLKDGSKQAETQNTKAVEVKPSHEPESCASQDNLGERLDTEAQAENFWAIRNASRGFDPFVLYKFSRASDARDALLELPCIHVVKDNRELICTEFLTFGYYSRADGSWDAFICGADLSRELWQQAKGSFTKHNGSRRNDQEPEQKTPIKKAPDKAIPEAVKYVRTERKGMYTYIIHKGPNAASAKAFLAQKSVPVPFTYLQVETPEGEYGRDADGIYKA